MKRKVLASLLVIAVVVGLVGAGTFALFDDTETSDDNIFQAGTLDLLLQDPGTGDYGNDVSGLITIADMEPGVESGYYTVRVKNAGSLPGKVSYTIEYTKITGTQPENYGGDALTADNVAKKIYVTESWFDRNCNDAWNQRDSYGSPWNYGSWTVGFDDPVSGMQTPYGTWEGAPHMGDFDEWVLPDWARWADTDGGRDGYLSLYEIGQKNWGIDDNNGTAELDPGQVYMWRLKFMLDPAVSNEFQAQGVNVTVTFTLNQE